MKINFVSSLKNRTEITDIQAPISEKHSCKQTV